MPQTDDTLNTDLAVRAAWLSFVGGYTQGEIANRLGVSQAKVHRLIAQAQKAGLVRFHVEGRPTACLELEERIVRRFGLRNCIVAPSLGSDPDDEEAAIRAVGSAAGGLLATILAGPDTKRVGIGKGRTLKAAIETLPRLDRNDLSVMSISGSLTPRLSANPYDVVQMLSAKTGGEGYFLPVPYIAADEAERERFLSSRSVQDLLDRARRADLFVIGIGNLVDTGHVIATGMIGAADAERLVELGAVGDVMGRFLDISGHQVTSDLNRRAVGLSIGEIRGGRVMALAGGAPKAAATIAGLNTGAITDLVVDEGLARELAAALDLRDRKLEDAN